MEVYDTFKDCCSNKEKVILSSDKVKKIKEVFTINKDSQYNKEKKGKIPLKNRQQNNN